MNEEVKKLIARLIDLKYISGDEAILLFEAIHAPKEVEKIVEKVPYWTSPISIPTTTWGPHDYTITCDSNAMTNVNSTSNDNIHAYNK